MIATQRFHERVEKGKAGEEQIAEVLRSHGLNLIDVDERTDMIDKIDRQLVTESGTYSVQIKFRDSSDRYRDFLLDLYEPFYGDGDPDTKIGRDLVSKYDIYVCRIKDTIYVINGKAQKTLVANVLEEWRQRRCQLPVFRSTKYSGVELRKVVDHRNNRPKLLMFIPPGTYSGKDVKAYSVSCRGDNATPTTR
jgi:hypothetical protein